MTWSSLHRREAVLRSVVRAADDRRDGILPTDVDGVPETFETPLDLLGALTLRWHTRLSGRVEARLGGRPGVAGTDREQAVVDAWRETAAAMPGVRAILDLALAEPADEHVARAMRIAGEKEHTMLALTAGVAESPGAAAAASGAEITGRARRVGLPIFHDVVEVVVTERPAGLLHRLRAALAA